MSKTIREFIREQKQRDCIVCKKITPELWKEIKTAQESGNVRLPIIFAWLKTEHGIVISPEQWQTHLLGRHKVVGK